MSGPRVLFGFLVAVLAVIQLGSSLGRADDEKEQRRMQAIAVAEAQLDLAERDMARGVKLLEAKAISQNELDMHRNKLAQARLQLAMLHDDHDAILASLREVVRCQETRLGYFERLRDQKVFSNEEVETYRLRVAESRIHLELRMIVGIREAQLDRLLKSQENDGASASDIARARKELEDAERRLELLRR